MGGGRSTQSDRGGRTSTSSRESLGGGGRDGSEGTRRRQTEDDEFYVPLPKQSTNIVNTSYRTSRVVPTGDIGKVSFAPSFVSKSTSSTQPHGSSSSSTSSSSSSSSSSAHGSTGTYVDMEAIESVPDDDLGDTSALSLSGLPHTSLPQYSTSSNTYNNTMMYHQHVQVGQQWKDRLTDWPNDGQSTTTTSLPSTIATTPQVQQMRNFQNEFQSPDSSLHSSARVMSMMTTTSSTSSSGPGSGFTSDSPSIPHRKRGGDPATIFSNKK